MRWVGCERRNFAENEKNLAFPCKIFFFLRYIDRKRLKSKNMKRVYYGVLIMMAAVLVASCSDGDGEMLNKNLDFQEAENANKSYFAGSFSGEWSMVDAKGEPVPVWDDDLVLSGLDKAVAESLRGKVTVGVERKSLEDPVKITVSAMPVWMINQWLSDVNMSLINVVVSTDPERSFKYDFSCSFLGELEGISSGKEVYGITLGSRFAFVCEPPVGSSALSFPCLTECTFMKTSQCLYNAAYDTMDLYLPIDIIAQVDSTNYRSEAKYSGMHYTIVLHAERVRQ